jgi:RNA polymerase sigma factor (TIGR02999 family)
MSEVTRILSAIEQGDRHDATELLPLVYDELRRLAAEKLARERPGQTLQATALVHEAFLRLVDTEKVQRWDSRGHFFAAAAEAIRRILVENARRKGRLKRGGSYERIVLGDVEGPAQRPTDDLVALDEALNKLAQIHPLKAELVKLRYFTGLTVPEAAQSLGISTTTADRYWTYSRAWLFRELAKDEHTGPGSAGEC